LKGGYAANMRCNKHAEMRMLKGGGPPTRMHCHKSVADLHLAPNPP